MAELGAKVRVDEVMAAAGFSKPMPGDVIIEPPAGRLAVPLGRLKPAADSWAAEHGKAVQSVWVAAPDPFEPPVTVYVVLGKGGRLDAAGRAALAEACAAAGYPVARLLPLPDITWATPPASGLWHGDKDHQNVCFHGPTAEERAAHALLLATDPEAAWGCR